MKNDHQSSEKLETFLAKAAADGYPTPFLALDLDAVAVRYGRVRAALPACDMLYAVKANPGAPLLSRLVDLGSGFDVASIAEIEACLNAGAPPHMLSYGNTIKKAADIARASDLGINLFAFDCEAELVKIGKFAPGARVYCRIALDNNGAKWPLAGKFGCSEDEAVRLLAIAPGLGLQGIGLSFHVGSQQCVPARWADALRAAGRVSARLGEKGISVEWLNMGGGFPVEYRDQVPEVDEIARLIEGEFSRAFKGPMPRLAIEPGRIIVAEAGIIRSAVVLVADRGISGGGRWVYLDIGRFSGLAETQGEAICYRLRTEKDGARACRVKIAGPTCDGQDILYEKTEYRLPATLDAGDSVDILASGAYTTSYSTVGFNGFSPLKTYYI